jgi:NADH:ubiquinone reductase (H+-translocating)
VAAQTSGRRPRVVIIGGGFAGIAAARKLKRAPVDVTVIDRTNHHLFQPLLYQVATAVLAPSDITVPIRWMLRKQQNTEVLMAEVHEVDVERRVVYADEERREIPYDFLILAAGARHSYFGHNEWEENAPGLKSINDALEIRRRFLLAFEEAEKTDDPAERAALQTFVIVGGGPTGVELAGMIPATARYAMHDDFRHIDTRDTRVILLEGGPRVLPTFHPDLSERARRDLEDLGVTVRTGALVTRIEDDAVYVGEERIPTRTVFWGAGNAAAPVARSLGAPTDRAGRVQVERDLSVPGHPELFVVGDLAAFTQDGKPVPGVAPAAMQQGAHAAESIIRTLRGEARAEFVYRDKGDLATIGRHKAVGSFRRDKLRITGRTAWWLWLFVHIMYLAGFRNRVSVLLQWAYAYFTYQRGVRLITGEVRRARPVAAAHSLRGW